MKKHSVVRLFKVIFAIVPVALAPLIAGNLLGSANIDHSFGSVFAAEEKAKPTQYKTKKSYALSQKVFKKFSKVQEKTDADNWRGALSTLKDIEKSSGTFSSYERANLWNYFAWVSYSLENNREAMRYYRKVLGEEQLSEALELGTLQTLAQMSMMEEDYRGAIKLLKKFMSKSAIVGADIYVLVGQCYYQMDDMKGALTNVNTAVNKYEAKGKIPKENWYALQRAIYFELGNNRKVINILEKLVKHYSKTTYWKQLAGMYGAEERELDQMHATEVVYLSGGLAKEKELLNLAYMFLGNDAPIKSANVFRKGIDAGIIEETSKNLEVYATALRLAQEVKKAIPVMSKAASKSNKGNLYATLAGIYLDNDQNKEALSAASKAFNKGGVKRPDQLNIVVGMANFNTGKLQSALSAFKKASKDQRSSKAAGQWIAYVESEIKRKKQLAI